MKKKEKNYQYDLFGIVNIKMKNHYKNNNLIRKQLNKKKTFRTSTSHFKCWGFLGKRNRLPTNIFNKKYFLKT